MSNHCYSRYNFEATPKYYEKHKVLFGYIYYFNLFLKIEIEEFYEIYFIKAITFLKIIKQFFTVSNFKNYKFMLFI